jgi:DNA-binding CsgD family transcriptional regulator
MCAVTECRQVSESKKQKSRVPGDKSGLMARPHAPGFLVADASLKLLFANNEANTILTYPSPSSQSLADGFQKKLRPGLFRVKGSSISRNGDQTVLRLRSGRRTYFCRVYLLNGNGHDSATLLVLGRRSSNPLALSDFYLQFQLTHREQQAVALLLQGLSNKEMAENMGISTNTVKAFLRMAAIRMGVSSRSGIVAKILGLLLASTNGELSNQGDIG